MREHLPDKLIESLRLKPFLKGEYLYHQEEKLTCIYFLLSGKLQVDYIQKNGTQAVLAFENPLSIIGEIEFFDPSKVLNNVQAIEDSLLFSVSISTVLKYGYDDPRFLRFIILYLRERVSFVSSLLPHSSQSAEYQVTRYLKYRKGLDGYNLHLENRESISALLGISVRQLNRTLKKLEVDGIIEIKNKHLTILNSDRLFSNIN